MSVPCRDERTRRHESSTLGSEKLRRGGNPTVNARIGFLPEESYLYRFLNGEETLKFYGRLFKIPSKELKRRVPDFRRNNNRASTKVF